MTGGMPGMAGPPGGPRPMMGPSSVASRPPSMSGAAPGMGPTYPGAPAPSRPGMMSPARPGLMPPPRLGSMQPGVLQPGAHHVPGRMCCDRTLYMDACAVICVPLLPDTLAVRLHYAPVQIGEGKDIADTAQATAHQNLFSGFWCGQYAGKCHCREGRIVCWQVMPCV